MSLLLPWERWCLLNISDFLRLIAGGLLALVSSYIGILVKNGYKEKTRKPKTVKPDEEVTEWNEGDLGGVSIADLLNKNS